MFDYVLESKINLIHTYQNKIYRKMVEEEISVYEIMEQNPVLWIKIL